MSAELKLIDDSGLTETERKDLETSIDSLIALHKSSRQEINRLVFESVAAMTAGEDYEQQLANKRGLHRFIGSITGSNKALQDKINSSRAAAQYASQQTLQRIAEQNLMSFDLITAVNNKLNASTVAIEGEINQVYKILAGFFSQSRSDMIQLESRVEQLERNVNILQWISGIKFLLYNGKKYKDLDDVEKIVCLTRDFYDRTGGRWKTTDLLQLQDAMDKVNLSPEMPVSYYAFLKELSLRPDLQGRLLDNKHIVAMPSADYMPLLSGMKKQELLEAEESYIVSSTREILARHNIESSKSEICDTMTEEYLAQKGGFSIHTEVECFDLMLELLFSLNQAESEGLFYERPESIISTTFEAGDDSLNAVESPRESNADDYQATKVEGSGTDETPEFLDNPILECDDGIIYQPVSGEVISQSKIRDKDFAKGEYGIGVGIVPNKGTLYAPCDGKVTSSTAQNKHCIGIESNGMEVLIHIGIKTEEMRGDGFEVFIKKGSKVTLGQELIRFDRDKIKTKGHDDTVLIMLHNPNDYSNIKCRGRRVPEEAFNRWSYKRKGQEYF